MIGSQTRNGFFGWTMAGRRGDVGAIGLAAFAGLLADYNADLIEAGDLSGADVAVWPDALGETDNDLLAAANRPLYIASDPKLNGHAAVQFVRASSERMITANDAPVATALNGSDVPYTAFAVEYTDIKASSSEAFQALYGFGNSAAAAPYAVLRRVVASSNACYRVARKEDGAAAVVEVIGPAAIIDQSPRVTCLRHNGTTVEMRAMGYSANPSHDKGVEILRSNFTGDNIPAVAALDTGDVTFNRFGVGCRPVATPTDFLNGTITRVAIYNRALTDDECMAVMDYLAAIYMPTYETAGELPGVLHWWDASQVAEAVDAACPTLPDQGSGDKDFTAAGAARPTVKLSKSGLKCLQFGTDDAMVAGVASDATFLSNGTEKSLFIAFRLVDAALDDNALHPLLDTVNNDTVNNVGFGLYFDDSTVNRSVVVKKGQGTATAILNNTSAADLLIPGEVNILGITYDATIPANEANYTLWLNGQAYASVDQGAAPVATVAANALTLGALAGGVTFANVQIMEVVAATKRWGIYEITQLGKILQNKWKARHIGVVAGNDITSCNDNSNGGDSRHRAFPAMVFDAVGTAHIFYRRARVHGVSLTGVLCQRSSADMKNWSAERVIAEHDDYDYRMDGAAILLQYGEHAGRIVIVFNRTSGTDLIVRGPAVIISDDNAGTWSTPVAVDADDPLVFDEYSASPHGLVELPSGRVLMVHSGSEGSGDDTTVLRYSDDGGPTWSAGQKILTTDPPLDRTIEPNIVRFADGTLMVLIRREGDGEIWMLKSTDDAATWTEEASQFAGRGSPRMYLDANERLYCVYRSVTGGLADKMVYRYTDDPKAATPTWSAERRSIERGPYSDMVYGYWATNATGTWLAFGLQNGADADVFCTLFEAAA